MTLSNEKILVTGATGLVGLPIVRELAKDNEVHAMARFRWPEALERLKATGAKLIEKDLAAESFVDLPDDFTYVFHAGGFVGGRAERDWQRTFEVNTQAVGRLMHHCRNAKGFLHCSTGSVYAYQGQRPLGEDDPPGVHIPFYSLSKIAAEAVVRFASSAWDLPATILRIFVAYGPGGGVPARRFDMLLKGEAVPLHPDKPNLSNPIHEDDYVALGIKAMGLGQTPPLTVNLAGSEAVSIEELCEYMGGLAGVAPRFDYTEGQYTARWADVSRMHEVLGRTTVHWRDGMRRMIEKRYPETRLRDAG